MVVDLVLHAHAAKLRPAVKATYGGRWFGRAWFRDAANQPYLYGNDGNSTAAGGGTSPPNATFVTLQGQVWPLLDAAFPLADTGAGPPVQPLLTPAEAQALLNTVHGRLGVGSPIGPRLGRGGLVWPAISQLATMAASALNSSLAWHYLNQHTWSVHAASFPDSWIGVWGGACDSW